MKKFGKMNLIFEFTKIRLHNNFHENLRRKKIDPFVKAFLTNQGKNEDGHEKFWENEFDI